jgi:hypothetical protein
MIEIIGYILALPLILAILYPIAIQYERGGLWQIFYLVAVPAVIVDFFANFLVFSIVFYDKPFRYSATLHRLEYTFSDRLERLVFELGWKRKVARFIAKTLNSIAPSKVHIRNYRETW